MKYFDKVEQRLIFFIKKIKKDFWDNLWLKHWSDLGENIYIFNPKSIVCRITQKFLSPKDGPILEGGCGLGYYVYSLNIMNYDVIGIDNAENIIKRVKKKFPNLRIEYGDVRQINFPDNYFAGYWSLGVIEHFFDGYDEILREMNRVIKSGGFLFITFPYMSPLRKFKSKAHLYKIINGDLCKLAKISRYFYQFALRKEAVIKNFEKNGFNLRYSESFSGIKGLKDEIFFLKFFFARFFQLLYSANRPKFIHYIKGIIEKISSRLSGHSILLIFQKK